MSKSLKAVYDNGVFRPLEPVELAEHQEVTVTVPDARGAAANHQISCYNSPKPPGCSEKNPWRFNGSCRVLKQGC